MFNRKRLTGLNPALLAAGYPLSPTGDIRSELDLSPEG